MRKALLYSVLGAILVLLAACSQVQPSTPEALEASAVNHKASFSGASAYFSTWDDCSYSEVWIDASKGMSRSGPGAGGRGAWAYISIHEYDYCTGSYTSASGSTALTNNALKVNGNLRSATLKTTLEVYDYGSDEAFTVRINLAWKGVGDLWQGRNRYQEKYPDYRYQSRWRWNYRSAEVSGSVMIGSSNLIQGLSSYGELRKTQEHTVVVDRRGPVIEWFDAWPQTIYEGQSAYLNWYVTAPDGTRLSIDQGIGDVTGQYGVRVSPTTTTTYTLTAIHRRQSSSAQVTVYVAPRPEPDRFESNDEPESATPIELDFYAADLNLGPGDVDWFTFSLSEALHLSAHASAWPLDLVMGLFDAGMNEMATGWSGVWEYLEPGRYYLAVSAHPDYGFSGDHGGIGVYDLSITTWQAPPPPPAAAPDPYEPNDAPAAATPLALDFFASDFTITPGDVDWFTFTLTEASSVAAAIHAYNLGSSLDSVMGLFDSSLGEIAINDDHDGLDSYLEVDLAAGTYYLAVSAYDDFGFSGDHSRQGFYHLSVTAAPPAP